MIQDVAYPGNVLREVRNKSSRAIGVKLFAGDETRLETESLC